MNTMGHTVSHPSDETLFDFVEGLTDNATDLSIAEHLHTCPECSALVATATAAANVLVSAELEQLPAEHSAQLHRTVHDEWAQRAPAAQRKSATTGWLRRLGEWRSATSIGLATALVALVAGGAIFNVIRNGDVTVDSGSSAKKPVSTDTDIAGTTATDTSAGLASKATDTPARRSEAVVPTSRTSKPASEATDDAVAPTTVPTTFMNGNCLVIFGHYNPAPKVTIVEGQTQTFLGTVRVYCS
jgi:anti-sigma factor RsiW